MRKAAERPILRCYFRDKFAFFMNARPFEISLFLIFWWPITWPEPSVVTTNSVRLPRDFLALRFPLPVHDERRREPDHYRNRYKIRSAFVLRPMSRPLSRVRLEFFLRKQSYFACPLLRSFVRLAIIALVFLQHLHKTFIDFPQDDTYEFTWPSNALMFNPRKSNNNVRERIPFLFRLRFFVTIMRWTDEQSTKSESHCRRRLRSPVTSVEEKFLSQQKHLANAFAALLFLAIFRFSKMFRSSRSVPHTFIAKISNHKTSNFGWLSDRKRNGIDRKRLRVQSIRFRFWFYFIVCHTW